jgi:hypothetical protein
MNLVRFKRVFNKFLGKFETSVANGADIRHALVRFEPMLLQFILPGIGQLAQVTRIRFLSSVSANVSLQYFGGWESFQAVATLVTSLRRARTVLEFYVSDEAVRMVEAGRTVLALLVASVQVHQHVVRETRFVDKVDAAEITFEFAR